jgi:hypothetical protein
LREAIAEAAKTRMTPVMLTTIAATIGLIPLAVGLNIDFVTLFTEFNPHIFFGGDNVAFWGPFVLDNDFRLAVRNSIDADPSSGDVPAHIQTEGANL